MSALLIVECGGIRLHSAPVDPRHGDKHSGLQAVTSLTVQARISLQVKALTSTQVKAPDQLSGCKPPRRRHRALRFVFARRFASAAGVNLVR